MSPDGKYLLFTGAAYSQFPIYLQSADVYILDLTSGRWKKLELNSNRADSFHSWSSNGRWIVFSSKRDDKVFTKPYFSHIDSLGCASKPFVLPQEDPMVYASTLNVYNVPEFTKEPVHISPHALANAAFTQQDETIVAKLDPNVLSNRIEDKSKPVVPDDLTKKDNKTKSKTNK